jgi:hypothetical protein
MSISWLAAIISMKYIWNWPWYVYIDCTSSSRHRQSTSQEFLGFALGTHYLSSLLPRTDPAHLGTIQLTIQPRLFAVMKHVSHI